jgi:predicted lipoprotein
MENLMLKGLQDLFDQLETGQLAPEQERFIIEREALKHKESIAELAEENAELKRRLWEYENRYRVGVLPTSGD